MRLESRTWFILSLILFVAAIYFWMRGNEYQSRKSKPAPPPIRQQAATNPPAASLAPAASPFKLLSRIDQQQGQTASAATAAPSPASALAGATTATASPATNAFPLRLSNTPKPVRELTRLDSAVLMRNAFIDTANDTALQIPAHLRTEGDPGSYIVQARGAIRPAFRERLREAGASIVSYIPNNAYLVQLSAEGAQRMAALPETQAVLPYEPYYKLDSKLLPSAVNQQPLEPDAWLRVTAFPGQVDALADSVTLLGGEVVDEERTPFGQQLLVKPAPDTLPAIARLASAQIVELFYRRELLTDQTRVVIGVANTGSSATNYLNLTGTNVMVNVNDSGVDSTHPDLEGRIFGDTPKVLADPFAHGTHITAVIAGSGVQSGSLASVPPGSETNANFRGIAPSAEIFALPFQAFPEVSRFLNDSYLQETAARTNATMSRRRSGPMVSNNSWAYVGVNEYDSSSARFDAAVRDALPDGTNSSGSHPMIFVFAAGNSGEGTDLGEGGEANSIPSPSNAKNVITVGALEHLRNITNAVVTTNELDGSVFTNTLFLGVSDSINEVAAFSSRGNVGIGVEGEFGRFKPDVVAPGAFIIGSRGKDWKLENEFDTNSEQYAILKEVNEPLAPYYRYESGTSQAAPVVSGMLALMQELFEQRLSSALRRTNSPALMKALLINGARSAGPLYSFQVQNSINYQGWGLVNITNTLPEMMISQPEAQWPIRYFDQTPTNALATGQSKSWSVALSTNAQLLPFRVTLVWTDPPGNPAAAIKLVNDLDLVVSNTVSGQVFYGNDIRANSDFTHGSSLDEPSTADVVNNVENVIIRESGSSNFVVSVVAKRVNVTAAPDYNAATGRTNDVVQDYALVIACGDPTATNAFNVTPLSPAPQLTVEPVSMTNGLPVLNQRVGANPALLNSRNGLSNQWNFYVFTNLFITNDFSSMTNGTNVAFVTFFPPNVARSRNESADIDLYVSKDRGLVELNPVVTDAAWKSVTRGGTELVVFTNAALGDVFYIGVKSEDQESGEYGLIALSSNQPFEEDENGVKVLHGMPVPQTIPDGTPSNPGRATVFAIGISAITVQNATVSNVLTHELVGDLSVILDHDQVSVVLHNHTLNDPFPPGVTNFPFVYDDGGFGSTPFSRRSDGPGSLNDFAGAQGNGLWMLNVVDNAPNRTGRVESVTIRLEPFVNADLGAAGAAGISGSVGPNDATCYFVDVPPEATNLIVNVSQLTGPLDVFISHDSLPTPEAFDKMMPMVPPGGTMMLGADDEPVPLGVGRYFICLRNSGTVSVNFHIATVFELGVGLDFRRNLIGTNAVAMLDDGMITSTVSVPVDKQVATVQVGVRIDHPRSADLVLHLISPEGTRLLLAENRGGSDSQGYGTGFGTNLAYTVFTEDTNLLSSLAPIKFSLPPWTNLNTATNPLTFSESFENATNRVYVTNETFSGWTVTQGEVTLHGPGSPLGVAPHTGTNFVELDTSGTAAAIVTRFGTIPGKDYTLTFNYQRNPSTPRGTAHAMQLYVGPPATFRPPVKFIDVPSFGWQSTNIQFRAASNVTELAFGALTGTGPLLDTIRVGDVVVGTNTYLLPEEPLSLLEGERAHGDWTLEIWDNRRGPVGIGPGVLLGWELQVEYGNPPRRATAMTNGVTVSGTVSGSQTNYFFVDVCDTSKVGFATLFGPFDRFFNEGKLQLLIDREGYPTGNDETDDFVPLINNLPLDQTNETSIAAIQFTDDPHQPAPLQPGRRLFFAIHNLNPGETNAFDFQVSFDNDTCTGGRPITRLENDVAVTNIVAPSAILFDYYVFNVSPAAIEAEFEVIPQNGDVGMVLTYGLPLPDLATFDYKSDQPGITNELIVLTNGSAPVSLLSGDWYVGVYNNSTNPAIYSVRASEVLDTNINLIYLTNGVSTNYTLLQGAGLTNFFVLRVPDPIPGVKFELFDLNGNADLLIDFNALPSPTNHFLSNSASPSQPVTVEVLTNDARPDLRGNWVLAVINKDPTNLTFTLRGSFLELTNAPPPGTNRFFDPDITVTATNICLSWDTTVGLQYRLEAKETLSDTNWQVVFGPETATATVMNHCIDRPTPFTVFQVVEIGGEVPPPPTEDRFFDPDISVTATNICFSWDTTVGLQYRLEAKETLSDTNWQVVFGPETATATVMNHCIDRPTPFTVFQVVEIGGEVPPPPTEDRFFDPDISVTATNICFSWDTTVGLQYRLEAKETLSDTNWQVVFGPETATLTVMNHCINRPTPFTVFQVVEIGGEVPPPPTEDRFFDPDISVTATNICFSWDATVGLQYRLEAKETLSDTNWQVVFGPETATSAVMNHCINRPTPFTVFQVVEIGGEVPPPPTEDQYIDPTLSVTATNICFSWNATVGLQYRLEAKETLSDTNWQVVFGPETATATVMNHCINRPTPFTVFQVVEIGGEVPPPTEDQYIDPTLSVTATNICFSWNATVGLQYRLEAKETLSDTNWQVVFGPQAAAATVMNHCIDRPTPFTVFQVVEIGGEVPPPPTGGTVGGVALELTTNSICLTWDSKVGFSYQVQGGETIVNVAWTNLSGIMVATNTSMSHCIPRPTPYQFFEVLEFGTGATNQPPPDLGIISLENGVLVTNTVSPGVVDYYVFNVTPTAQRAEFLARPIAGDIGLVLSRGLPLPDPSSTNSLDYLSDRPGTTNELIVVTGTSIPESLAPGDWFVGVYNNSTNLVAYDIRASEVLDTNVNLITLTNALPRTFTLAPGAGLTNFFLFKVFDPVPGVKFELYDLTGDADLLVGIDNLPSVATSRFREPAPVTFELKTNTIPDMRGSWVLAVLNNQPTTNLSFTVRASFLGATNSPGGQTNDLAMHSPAVLADGRFQLVWETEAGSTYEVQFTTDLTPVVTWTSLTNLVSTGATATLTDTNLVTDSVMRFYRVLKR